MILHLIPGTTLIEVHVHDEYGVTERLTVAPRADAPGLAASSTPVLATPPAARGNGRLLMAVPVVAALFGFAGYQVGSRGAGADQDVLRAISAPLRPLALRTDPIPRPRDPDASLPLAPAPIRSAPLQPATAADPGPVGVPPALAHALAQRPSIAPSPGGSVPAATAPQPAAPAGGNPFGLE